LAFFCVENFNKFFKLNQFPFFFLIFFSGKSICELGGGYSGLASLALASLIMEEKNEKNELDILITDGNEKCVES